MLEEQFANTPHFEIVSLSSFQLTLLDAALYHLCTRLVLEEDVDTICTFFPALTAAKYIEAVEADRRDPNRPPLILPVIGKNSPALFAQIFQISWLGRQFASENIDQHELALRCLAELEQLHTNYSTISDDDLASLELGKDVSLCNSDISTELFFIAADIFVAKILNPEEVTTNATQIQTLVKNGANLLERFDPTMPFGQFICWPLLILGCAACPTVAPNATQYRHNDPDGIDRDWVRRLIRNKLMQVWNVSYSGFVHRVLATLEKMWKRPRIFEKTAFSEDSSGHTFQYDGLHALIHKDGLCSLFFSESEG